MSLAEDIQAVHDYIDEHGWCQREYATESGQVCLMGGVGRAMPSSAFDGFDRRIAMLELIQQVISQMTSNSYVIPVFNDEILRDKSDVLDFLQKCRIRAEEFSL